MLAIPVLGRGDRQIPRTCRPARLAYLVSYRPVRDLVSRRNKRGEPEEQHAMLSSGFYMYPTHVCMYTCTDLCALVRKYTHTHTRKMLIVVLQDGYGAEGEQYPQCLTRGWKKNITREPESTFCEVFN